MDLRRLHVLTRVLAGVALVVVALAPADRVDAAVTDTPAGAPAAG